MKIKSNSLRIQFLTRLVIVLLVIIMISSLVQLYFIKSQITENVNNKASVISQSIELGMDETNLASQSIEHQIDLRLGNYGNLIAEKLNNQSSSEISNQELINIKKELGISGITLFAKKGNDIVGVKSTEHSEIGFSFKKIGYNDGFKALDSLYKNKRLPSEATYSAKNMFALPISQSGSQSNPRYYKYAYLIKPGRDYIINPYIEANEIYHFTKEVGPETWIDKIKEKNTFIKEIGVLNPSVFENPKLETKLFPPIKKVVYGEYSYKDKRDKQLLAEIIKNKPIDKHYINSYDGDKVYKLFLPAKDGNVVYVALDYKMLSGPLYRHSIILIVTGLVSLMALFLLTARFFNVVYGRISAIKIQIGQLEKGDLTAKSTFNDKSELGDLSESVNEMASYFNKTVSATREQAAKTQQLSLLLEAEASQSVTKMYEISTEATLKSRDQHGEIVEFLNKLIEFIQTQPQYSDATAIIKQIEEMKKVANDRTSATTDFTITLSDLLQSLYLQSSELSNIANIMLESMRKFKL
ncbi:methyl-accepting chemotaxis protein [Bacillus sp. MUM 13]|uniref:HAMP domain-containing protein n=1 Tax=Bacillus sp. MUM 13 TaxID=1678001 RepID=UPI0009F45BCF|nr:methyl-accepting chemotaxis protein [Bacillus sp. MUM 13]